MQRREFLVAGAGVGGSVVTTGAAALPVGDTVAKTASPAPYLSNDIDVYFQQSPAGSATAYLNSATKSVHEKLQEFVSVKDFGAKGDGATDDTLAINRAIASGAKVVIFPNGTYNTSSSINIDISAITLIGNDSVINLNVVGGTQSHFLIGNNGVITVDDINRRSGIRIDGFILIRPKSLAAAAGGAGFTLGLVGDVTISNCRIFGQQKIYRGIYVYRGIRVTVRDCYIQDCINSGITLEGTGTGANTTIDFVLSSCRIEGCASVGLGVTQYVVGLYVRNTIFYNNLNHVNVDGVSLSSGNLSYKFLNCDFDTTSAGTGGYGLILRNVKNIQICNSWFSNNRSTNILADASVNSLSIVGNQFYTFNSPLPKNLDISAQSVVINGNLIQGGDDCVLLRAAAQVVTIGNNQISGAAAWGINNFLSPSRVTIIGNTFYLNTAGAISSGGISVIALAGANNL